MAEGSPVHRLASRWLGLPLACARGCCWRQREGTGLREATGMRHASLHRAIRSMGPQGDSTNCANCASLEASRRTVVMGGSGIAAAGSPTRGCAVNPYVFPCRARSLMGSCAIGSTGQDSSSMPEGDVLGPSVDRSVQLSATSRLIHHEGVRNGWGLWPFPRPDDG